MKPAEKKIITKFISSGDTARAIDVLTETLEGSKTSKVQLTTLYGISARYHKLMDEKSRGILFKADEEVLQSRINNDLLSLLDQIGKPIPTGASQPEVKAEPVSKKQDPVKPASRLPALLSVVSLAAAVVIAYFMFFNEKSPEVQFPKVCVLTDLDSQCCPETYHGIRAQDAKRQLVVSVLLNHDLPDPYITGIVYDQQRNLAPIRQLTFTRNENAICYSGLLRRSDNSNWMPGRYTIEFFVNQQPAGNMDFSLIE